MLFVVLNDLGSLNYIEHWNKILLFIELTKLSPLNQYWYVAKYILDVLLLSSPACGYCSLNSHA